MIMDTNENNAMGSYKSEEMWISQKKLERLDNALEFRGLGLEDNITV